MEIRREEREPRDMREPPREIKRDKNHDMPKLVENSGPVSIDEAKLP
jgi:hypothetical protein